MGRRVCIPGVICIENITLFVIVVFLVCFFYYFFISVQQHTRSGGSSGDKIVVNVPPQRNALDYRDVLLNPYAAPFYDQNWFSETASPLGYGGSNFRQVGILTPKNGANGEILPLMGRPLTNRSGQWNYYTISNQHNNVKIPVKMGPPPTDCKGRRRRGGVGIGGGGKNGLNEYGVSELGDGNDVYLDGYNKEFGVTMYENANIPYTPF